MSKRKVKGDPAPEVSLPITPMLDMTFQLLTFFIITFNPNRLVEGQDVMALPPPEQQNKATNTANIKPTEKSDKEKPPEIEETFFVRVKVDRATGGGQTVEYCTIYFRQRDDKTNGEALGVLKFPDKPQDFKDANQVKEARQRQADNERVRKAVVARVTKALKEKFQKIEDSAKALPDKERKEQITKEKDRVLITIEAEKTSPWRYPVLMQDWCEQAEDPKGVRLIKRDRIVFGKPLGME